MQPKHHTHSPHVKHMLIIAALAGLALAMTVLSPGKARAETLDDAFKAALTRDFTLKSADDSIAASQEDLRAARAHRLPTLSGQAACTLLDNTPSTSVGILPFLPRLTIPLLEDDHYLTSQVSLSVPVFTSFRITHGVHAAEAASKAAYSARQTTEQDVKLDTARAYVTVLRARHGLAVAQSNVAALKGHARDVENAHQNGLVPRNDVLAVKVARADARQTEIKAANGLALARAAYNRQLGRPLDSPVSLADLADASQNENPVTGSKNINDAELIMRARENRSEIKQLDEQEKALAFKAKSIRASALPQIQVSGSYNHLSNTFLDKETIWAGSVGVRWDVFDGGVIRHQARSEDNKRSALENMKKQTESLISLQVKQACLDLEETAKRITVTESALAQAEENLVMAKNRYRKDIGSNTEVLDAETLRINSMTNHMNAVYDLVMARLRLKRATGDL